VRDGDRPRAEGQPSVRLARLEDPATHLVKSHIRGRQTFYSLDRRGLDDARTYLEGLENVAAKYGDRPPGEQTGKH
jgi:hypothetical protein